MVRLLRWGTFVVLLLAIVGAAYSYPLLRDRFAPSSLAGPAPQVTGLSETAAIAQATTPVPATPSPTATTPVLIIQAPSPTAAEVANMASATAATFTPLPAALATTSLLPATTTSPAITPVVLDPTTVEQPRPSLAATSALTPGQPSATAVVGADGTITPIVVTPILVTPIVVTTVEVSSSVSASAVTPMVVTTVELTPQPDTPTPMPLGPTSRAESPLYRGPDFNAAIVGQVQAGEQLTIVGLYTEGTWYLLVNGMWISGAVVDNAPLTLPLVSPTITPVATSTPTITPTPPPTATPLGSATPTPTPTSLEQPVCDCSGDTLDCLGNIFDNRAEAQQCFEYCFRQTGLDIHLLDPNLNGMACENLP